MRSPPAALVLAAARRLSRYWLRCGYVAMRLSCVSRRRRLASSGVPPLVLSCRRRRSLSPPSPAPPVRPHIGYLIKPWRGSLLLAQYININGSKLSVGLLGRISKTINKTLLGLVAIARLRLGTHWVSFCSGVSASFPVLLTHRIFRTTVRHDRGRAQVAIGPAPYFSSWHSYNKTAPIQLLGVGPFFSDLQDVGPREFELLVPAILCTTHAYHSPHFCMDGV